jgi:hypothetical protein
MALHALAAGAGAARSGDAALVLRWLRHNGLETFTVRECQQRLRARFRWVSQLEPVIEDLVRRGHIAPLPPPGTVGRPPRRYRVLDPGTGV